MKAKLMTFLLLSISAQAKVDLELVQKIDRPARTLVVLPGSYAPHNSWLNDLIEAWKKHSNTHAEPSLQELLQQPRLTLYRLPINETFRTFPNVPQWAYFFQRWLAERGLSFEMRPSDLLHLQQNPKSLLYKEIGSIGWSSRFQRLFNSRGLFTVYDLQKAIPSLTHLERFIKTLERDRMSGDDVLYGIGTKSIHEMRSNYLRMMTEIEKDVHWSPEAQDEFEEFFSPSLSKLLHAAQIASIEDLQSLSYRDLRDLSGMEPSLLTELFLTLIRLDQDRPMPLCKTIMGD